MLEDDIEIENDDIVETEKCGDKEKRRLAARRKLEERLEEKRLREEIFDDCYSY